MRSLGESLRGRGLDWETLGQSMGIAGMLGGRPGLGELRTPGKGPCTLPALAGMDFGSQGAGDTLGPLGPYPVGPVSEECGVQAKLVLGAQFASAEGMAR